MQPDNNKLSEYLLHKQWSETSLQKIINRLRRDFYFRHIAVDYMAVYAQNNVMNCHSARNE